MKKLNVNGKNLKLVKSTYANNGNLYLGLMRGSECYADISINLNYPLNENQIFVNGDLDSETFKALQKLKLLGKVILEMPYNYGCYKLVDVNMDMVNEYAV